MEEHSSSFSDKSIGESLILGNKFIESDSSLINSSQSSEYSVNFFFRESISFLAVLFMFALASTLFRSNISFDYKSKISALGLKLFLLGKPIDDSCQLLNQVGVYWQYLVDVFLPLFLIGRATLLILLLSSSLLENNENRLEKVVSEYLFRLQVFFTLLGDGTVCHSFEVL